ncbi:MAG TPA: rhomboid family intramembrane serine protease [Candidatus Limnocylindrales bacterium]|nr:rhomboid family intramembrane serine protease [Candidatus Limnocylindrales bacterium]
MIDRTPTDSRTLLDQSGPLSRETAQDALAQAASLMASADFLDAAQVYQRVIGTNDVSITGAAMVGLGEALHRLDHDDEALSQWEAATELGENEYTYAAWRNVAAARVRSGDLRGALNAYREADRRAPGEDKAEIANRMGWLAKELGDRGAAGKYFSKARGDAGFSVALGLLGVTVVVSLLADFVPPAVVDLFGILQLDKPAMADSIQDAYRLVTVTLLHAPITQMPLHLMFNMYALYLAGPFVERLYGRVGFLVLYVGTAIGGSLASFAFGDAAYGVGASGAIFGLFGLLIAVQYIHRPVLDRGSRAFMGQLVGLVILNLILGFAIGGIDNWAHIGGLVTGLWLGFLLAPRNVPTMRSMWMRPGSTPGTTVPALGPAVTSVVRVAGLGVLVGLFAMLWILGVAAWG